MPFSIKFWNSEIWEFEKPFDEYAKGIQSSEEKIDLVHSKLKSMYREQKEFVDSLNKNGENSRS